MRLARSAAASVRKRLNHTGVTALVVAAVVLVLTGAGIGFAGAAPGNGPTSTGATSYGPTLACRQGSFFSGTASSTEYAGWCGSTGPAPSQANPVVAYVDVSVITEWSKPTSPTKPTASVNKLGLSNPVTMTNWLATLTTRDKSDMARYTETQTQGLLGNKVYIFKEATYQGTAWDEIAIPGEPSPKNPLGYPGWVPAAQLTETPPASFRTLLNKPFALVNGSAVVTLYNTPQLKQPFMKISYDTFLPLVGQGQKGTAIHVQTPTQGAKWLSASTSTVYTSYADIPVPTGTQVAADAKLFLGRTYFWGGRSGWDDDCSGLTSMIYQANGITIDRDSNAQAIAGLYYGDPLIQWTNVSGLKAGDVMYYATHDGTHTETIYHNAMYVGTGMMEEAYDFGVPIRLSPARTRTSTPTPSLTPGQTYWGAIQFLPTTKA